jgi:hypothetical protein
MKTLSADTSPEAEAVQIALFRAASTQRRFALARSLSMTMGDLSRRGIRRSHPGASDREVGLLFISYHYGPELAERVRSDLARRDRL